MTPPSISGACFHLYVILTDLFSRYDQIHSSLFHAVTDLFPQKESIGHLTDAQSLPLPERRRDRSYHKLEENSPIYQESTPIILSSSPPLARAQCFVQFSF